MFQFLQMAQVRDDISGMSFQVDKRHSSIEFELNGRFTDVLDLRFQDQTFGIARFYYKSKMV